ncbi:hypothetical protein IC007_0434 [Sulfuracidifex tepidarius]|uniref:Uncharacterized protein n=1 Tax=Sulfuracidifex tepidarius TaxID=1294262 RepID=A0A510E0C1_9CREN|nr:hypothetical protein IC007_0434 [Sulfuracidifex tepidarius]
MPLVGLVGIGSLVLSLVHICSKVLQKWGVKGA